MWKTGKTHIYKVPDECESYPPYIGFTLVFTPTTTKKKASCS